MKEIPRRKSLVKFGSKKFALHGTYNKKSRAKQEADIQRRDHNRNARVIRSGKKYRVFREFKGMKR